MKKLIIGLILIVGMIVFILYSKFLGYTETINLNNYDQLTMIGKVIFVWGYFGTFGIWVWMLVDFFRGYSTQYRVAWGIFLLVGTFAVATL